ncbi:phosphatase PAP2 family protein [Raoultella ornithinolytica]|uniref:Phosphatase PAP2 family protein n=1 Tax=Raoultella ornithinolytica TaxID=54291 RepID=A0A9Q9JJY6_RAOOR|nr:phosphatase PAP2 family protein [Raoultella ornithinolytica]EJD6651271.1 phosphatase PAP2 family protein [Raoultella ornithinolytica]ELV3662324.1 phosphatase PAP2 family protein [Raoultella ornithinolytica]MCZ0103979.1 phosphatase PAP2 family protein [Raoultella ornithinolytica]MDC7940948.1 phosphatase PAP2 family protein [Raoultella ornithinolytica]MDI0344360.1 phosphatase PAP2 family protein [Raoultella ornithinolytica]
MNWQWVSFFGDSTVLLPSAAAVFMVLFLRRPSRQIAWQWGLLFGITGAIVSASKLAFMGWGIGIRELDFTGFSGHTALSTAFWPIFLWLLCTRGSVALRRTAVVMGYLLAGLVGYSRLAIHAHSPSEVIAGLLLGACGSALFLLLQRNSSRAVDAQLSWGGVLSLIIIPVVLLNIGTKAPTQSLLGEIAVKLGPLEKPFTRSDMHKHFY